MATYRMPNIPYLSKVLSSDTESELSPPPLSPATTSSSTVSSASESPGLWKSLVDGIQQVQGSVKASPTEGLIVEERKSANVPLPKRWMDFFCVVGPSSMSPFNEKAQPSTEPDTPTLLDCYPPSHEDMVLPKELPTFCLPHGCHALPAPAKKKLEPIIFTFVLTSGNGNRLYCTVLTMYEKERGANRKLRKQQLKAKAMSRQSSDAKPSKYYLPKCLVLISHYPFFDAQTKVLKELYYVATSETSPLPIERYIAHLIHDVSLPPLGVTRVQWDCFTNNTTIRLQRPAPNEFPLANIPFKPLFRTLSLSNLLVVWGTLLQEGRVVLCSQLSVTLLTPMAEALLSLLFPLTWQGLYIPVLPANMMEILDAPVPYLVGVPVSAGTLMLDHHPDGVLICDLDNDILHLGFADQADQHQTEILPSLPSPGASRLQGDLEEIADPLYLLPSCGTKGRMTIGDGTQQLMNSMREPYALMTRINLVPVDSKDGKAVDTPRTFVLSQATRVPRRREALSLDEYILSRNGYHPHDLIREPSDLDNENTSCDASGTGGSESISRTFQARADRFMSYVGQEYATPSPHALKGIKTMKKLKEEIAATFFDLDTTSFVRNVREIFLRFFTTLFRDDDSFISKDKKFDHTKFVKSLKGLSSQNRAFVRKLVHTQMFERLLHDESCDKRRQLFGEFILWERQNAPQPTTMFGKAKEPTPPPTTPLLNTSRWEIEQVVVPCPPCSIGVSPGKVFSYKKGFPAKLDHEECVTSKTIDPYTAVFCRGASCTEFLSFS